MKRLVIAFAMIVGLGANAPAQDGFLRFPTGLSLGTPSYWNWSGIYFGGHAGYSSAVGDFSRATADQSSYILRESVLEPHVSNWAVLGQQGTSETNYGGFVGFNTQWENVIVGLEANYSRTNMFMSSSGALGPLLIADNTGAPEGHDYVYTAAVSSSASVRITDILTLRARSGWAAGPFLPYMFAGAAIGRANIMKTTSVSATLTDSFTVETPVVDPVTGAVTVIELPRVVGPSPITFNGNPAQDNRTGMFVYGFSAGVGIDIALFQNVFVRAEYEYIRFPWIKNIDVQIQNVRAGIGIKF